MKKILLFPLSLLLLFICLSCTRDVILKLDPAPPVLVLNASVTPERKWRLFVKSWFCWIVSRNMIYRKKGEG